MILRKICKEFKTKNNTISVLKNVSVNFKENKFYVIMGRSGSGKTTLVNILGLLDNYTSGEYILDGHDVKDITENEKAMIRNKKIGFVFQSFYLNSKLTALENVLLPTLADKNLNGKGCKQKAIQILESFGLSNRINHYPNQLSGGEQQRVAIARALINDPKIIIADEPTGNLDSKNEKDVFEILKRISKEGKIVIVVSHNPIIKKYCDVLYNLNDGILTEDEVLHE